MKIVQAENPPSTFDEAGTALDITSIVTSEANEDDEELEQSSPLSDPSGTRSKLNGPNETVNGPYF